MAVSLREKAYNRIRDDITYGKLSPGERLIEKNLVEEFHISRSPIREALRQLESEGLIAFKNYKGITVSKLSLKQVEEIYNLRWVLESYAASLSAERATKNYVANLRNLHEKLKVAAETFDLIVWLELNTLFHDSLSQNSGNSNLIQILDILKRRIYRYKFMVLRVPGHLNQYITHHEGILKAFEKNDGRMAEKYMKIHVEHIKNVLLDYLKKSLEK
jgi:DNA-binding GntR family transcriptional regulator